MIPQIEPSFTHHEADACRDLILSGSWLTEHTATRELEAAIAEFLEVEHCVMMPNCTLALYAAMYVTGYHILSDTIIPDFTMVATAQAVGMVQSHVRLVDIDPETLCMNLEAVEKSIESFYTNAIVPVHINGRVLDDIDALLNSRSFQSPAVPVIEDAAQAFGSRHNGQYLGTFGDIGCFSFSPHKIISTGQGGCCVTNSSDLADRLRRFKLYGRIPGTRHSYDRYATNLKFTDLQAVVGLAQMRKLPGRIERKKEIYGLYRRWLKDVEEIQFIKTNLEQTVPWYVDILIDDPAGLAEYLSARGIGTQRFYEPLHQQSFLSQPGDFPNATYAYQHGLWLPSSITLTDKQIKFICGRIKEYYGDKQ